MEVPKSKHRREAINKMDSMDIHDTIQTLDIKLDGLRVLLGEAQQNDKSMRESIARLHTSLKEFYRDSCNINNELYLLIQMYVKYSGKSIQNINTSVPLSTYQEPLKQLISKMQLLRLLSKESIQNVIYSEDLDKGEIIALEALPRLVLVQERLMKSSIALIARFMNIVATDNRIDIYNNTILNQSVSDQNAKI